MNTVPSVQPLQRLKLRLKAGPTAASRPNALPALELAFIFGIGTAGLTPFECLLNRHLAGDEIEFRAPGPEAAVFFGHLAPLVGPLDGDETFFSVRIVAVETPAPREVIKAMAEMASHDHGTGCGCGCGCR